MVSTTMEAFLPTLHELQGGAGAVIACSSQTLWYHSQMFFSFYFFFPFILFCIKHLEHQLSGHVGSGHAGWTHRF